jgi:cytochrome b561
MMDEGEDRVRATYDGLYVVIFVVSLTGWAAKRTFRNAIAMFLHAHPPD